MRPLYWFWLLVLAPVVGAACAYAGLGKGTTLLVMGAIVMAAGAVWGRKRR